MNNTMRKSSFFAIFLVLMSSTSVEVSGTGKFSNSNIYEDIKHWLNFRKSSDTADTICVAGVDSLDQGQLFPSHFIVASTEATSDEPKLLCSKSSFLHYDEAAGTFAPSTDNPSAPVHMWDSFHINSSAIPSAHMDDSESGTHGVHISNESPYNFQMNGLTGVKPGSNLKYTIKKNELVQSPFKTLPWIANYVAQFLLNSSSGCVDDERIGSIKAAMMYNNYDVESNDNDVASTASYALLQPVSSTVVSFYMLEANFKRIPSQNGHQRKLLMNEGGMDASHGYTLESTTACPNGYCMRRPKKWIAPSCVPKNRAYPSCLFVCICK